MAHLEYIGFSGTTCSCDYAVGEIDGKKAVVFVQGHLTQTSITNMIEVLASKVLSAELAGTDPTEVRFFEHYPPHLKPLRVWQEVAFAERQKIEKRSGLLDKLLGALRSDKEPPSWTVDSPQWGTVSEPLAAKLKAILP